MGLDKAIQYGKERRKSYTGAKAICCSCRNNGTCEWCKNNRLYQYLKVNERTLRELEEYEKGDDM